MKKFIGLLLLPLVMVQCNKEYEYSDTVNVDNSWYKKNALTFDFTIKDKTAKEINFVVRNNKNYPFSNLYLFVRLSKGKKVLAIDTLNYPLATPSGEWLGTGMGSVKEMNFNYKTKFSFPEKGNYNIQILQGMRKDTLPGIEDFSLTIK